eukprot:TRINITY_DN22678_c0_g1_i1.p2 TRINITY_DN22678_c0_g1~~TRINITY_DN22678_c0_g1_i1.p2  ORF type:complete len:129 (-),score=33.07 TRINITY_DN22678_c0_g1_i1:157-543(-)
MPRRRQKNTRALSRNSQGHGLASRFEAMTRALFNLCDVDQSGWIEIDEFVEVCLEYTPDVVEEQIKATFQIVGADDQVIDFDEFGRWVAMMFADCSEDDFIVGMVEFEEATNKARATLFKRKGMPTPS